MEFGYPQKFLASGLGKCRSCQPVNLVPGSWTLELYQVEKSLKPHQTSHRSLQPDEKISKDSKYHSDIYILCIKSGNVVPKCREVLKIPFWQIFIQMLPMKKNPLKPCLHSITVVKSATSPSATIARLAQVTIDVCSARGPSGCPTCAWKIEGQICNPQKLWNPCENILLMDEILHHLVCMKPCK